ncbi:MAG TPA: hypothetical protein VFI84_00815 [Candidatus Saccharimonadales bacterium]|nr:hypothetical protein [Candidatus Saccharimonadales bacterium]
MSKEHIAALLLNADEYDAIQKQLKRRRVAGYALGGSLATAGVIMFMCSAAVGTADAVKNFDPVSTTNNATVSEADPTLLFDVGLGLASAGLVAMIVVEPLSMRVEDSLALRKLHNIQPSDIVISPTEQI